MKSTLSALAAAVMAFGIMSCNNQPQANDTKETARPAAATASAGSQQIAYVEIDSIMGQYKYWKEVTKILEAKEKNIQKTLAGKQQALQQAAANFQQNVQANKFTQVQAQQIQAGIQRQAADAEALQQRLGAEYQKDSVHNYLKTYNKDKRYVMILAKSGDNILYADDACNITTDVVQGMNKAYTGLKK